jgi:hypothetical protein
MAEDLDATQKRGEGLRMQMVNEKIICSILRDAVVCELVSFESREFSCRRTD